MRSFYKIILSVAIAAVLTIGVFAVLLYREAFVSVNDHDETIQLYTLETGMTPQSINKDLAQLGLIRMPQIANLVVRLNGWFHIQAGEYELSTALTLEEMYEKFQTGAVVEAKHRITIPEGENLAFIASLMAPVVGLTATELLDQWHDEDLLRSLIEDYWFLTEDILNEAVKHPLEGYIYPITYDFTAETYEVDVLTRQLLSMTEERLESLRPLIEASSLSTHEVFTLASIVEGETPNIEEMPIVAGVFYNRLAIDMMLQSCATIQYILEERVVHVTNKMISIESPFNTYRHTGLPVGPVGHPSIHAIQAVLEPVDHEYFYFIGDLFHCVDGQTHFFTTFEEHKAFYEAYLLPSYEAEEGICQ